MDEQAKPTDELLKIESILAIHHRMKKVWVQAPLYELLERENALGAYVMGCGERISEFLTHCGIAEDTVRKTRDAAMKGMLVCIQAQHDAHFELWRDFMGDPAPEQFDRPDNTSKGDNNG
jgi:hypothetical protein